MINIAQKDVLEAYLLSRELVKENDGHQIFYCSGGVSGTVAFVERPGTPMIIKQALGQLKTKDTWMCDPNRMYTEYESNRIYHELMPDCAPEVYFYDSDNYIYGREAVPNGCPMWKENLMTGLLDFQVAEKSIRTLVNIHNACSSREDIKKEFENKDIFYDLRISPYIEFTAGKYPQIQEAAVKLSKELMDAQITLVHGDYSPKNIMVVGRDISVLDYEVAHFGHPAFDLAFFSNHFILKAVKFSEYAGAYLTMLQYMVRLYFDEMSFMDKDEFESAYVRTLAFLMLARIDGKSPVEYLVGQEEKQNIVRELSLNMIGHGTAKFEDALKQIKDRLEK